jgi:FAD:protein FMN transferase
MSYTLPAISALGTTWLVEVFDTVSKEKLDETYSLVQLFLSNFENKYSRFNSNSELSQLNKTGQLINPDQATVEILRHGQKFFTDTSGIFNILIGEHLLARGYDASYSFKPVAEPKDFPSPLIDLLITDTGIRLTKGQLDLGGYGKGYLLDLLASYLKEELGLSYFLINGGGDMYATSDHNEPITIYLEHPTEPGTYIAETTLKDQGFAASSTHKRRWQVSGNEYSHIVDTRERIAATRTHQPDKLGLYVKAPQAVTADAWATTLLISDPKDHLLILEGAQVDYACFTTSDKSFGQSSNF